MKVTPMKISDYEDAYEIWRSCVGMRLNNLDDSKNGVEAFLKRNPETCFVAAEEGRLVGVIMAGHDGRRGYIYHTAVCPNQRNRGIASALVNKVPEAMTMIGIHKIGLVVFERN